MSRRLYVTALAVAVSCSFGAAITTARLSAQAVSAPVADAAMKGDTSGVRTLLRGGADVNAAQPDGMTALHWTALANDLETMEVLLYAGATTDPLTRVGAYTPLHLASSRGHAAAVARLLAAGSKVGPFTTTGVQPLHLAAQAGNAETVKALVDRGADINAKDKTHGRTPLVFAASRDRVDAVKLLLARGADAGLTTTVIDYRARAAADTEARQLRDKIASARTGRAIDSNFDPDPPPPGAAAPGQAARGGQGPAVEPNDPNATQQGRRGGGGPRPPSDIEQIGKQGGFTALHYAARDGFPAVALALLDAGVNINVPTDGDRSTPMLVAIVNGQYDLALTFLARGADPNLANDDGVAPLFATLNNEWALRTWYPQPTAGAQQ
jgi:ankyrin repeat protein